jgi:hypothetical protein
MKDKTRKKINEQKKIKKKYQQTQVMKLRKIKIKGPIMK